METRAAAYQERVIYGRLFLDMARAIQRVSLPSLRLGAALEVEAVILAIFLAQNGGRPISLSRLAANVEMPRSTALRKLSALIELGIVERRGMGYVIAETVLSSEAKRRMDDRIVRMVMSASKKLSILDTEMS